MGKKLVNKKQKLGYKYKTIFFLYVSHGFDISSMALTLIQLEWPSQGVYFQPLHIAIPKLKLLNQK